MILSPALCVSSVLLASLLQSAGIRSYSGIQTSHPLETGRAGPELLQCSHVRTELSHNPMESVEIRMKPSVEMFILEWKQTKRYTVLDGLILFELFLFGISKQINRKTLLTLC